LRPGEWQLEPSQAAHNVGFKQGSTAREGELAEPSISCGKVKPLSTHLPARGAVVIETLDPGETSAGRGSSSLSGTPLMRARSTTRAVAFDGACLRGNEITTSATASWTLRVRSIDEHTRLRLLDIGHGSDS
jgi:hypothetical protein